MTVDGPEATFKAFLTQGRFMLQRARRSGRFFFYPRVAEPQTGDCDFDWVEASGDGAVYSVTVIRKKSSAEDYAVALVDLAEGPRMMATVAGVAPDAVNIGMPVRAFVGELDGTPAIIFKPAIM
jgi:uncharacterized protein